MVSRKHVMIAGTVAMLSGLGAGQSAAHENARYTVFANDGPWQIRTGTNAGGNAFCAAWEYALDTGDVLIITIFPFATQANFLVRDANKSWTLPLNSNLPTKFDFSDGHSWLRNGAPAPNHVPRIDYAFDNVDMQNFLQDFSKSDGLDIVFNNGPEPGWTPDLTQSTQATTDLLGCANNLRRDSGAGGPP